VVLPPSLRLGQAGERLLVACPVPVEVVLIVGVTNGLCLT